VSEVVGEAAAQPTSFAEYEFAVMVAALTHVISSGRPAAVGATVPGQQGKQETCACMLLFLLVSISPWNLCVLIYSVDYSC
jgi:hypothetical protein